MLELMQGSNHGKAHWHRIEIFLWSRLELGQGLRVSKMS
jgi:hypothetical protein